MDLNHKLKLYCSGILIYTLGILIVLYLPYYQRILTTQTKRILLLFYFSYLIISPAYYYFFTNRYSRNKPLLFFQGIKSITQNIKLKKEEKVAFLFLLVKIFFLPLMVNFFINNLNNLLSNKATFMHLSSFNWYPLTLMIIFTLDTLVFSFGYAFEFKSLKNIVKSVEPTLFGWIVTLICYPPFNSMLGHYVPWGANDYVHFWNPILDLLFKIVLISLLIIYLWATFALGFKASNLTNRGIVSKFPYSIVRHPAYVSKNLVWWISMLPIINWKFALGMGVWTLIYFFRAITEERHLSQDEDYLRYKKKVRWRFIPKLI